MGVDYYSCGECGKGFPDVIEYSSCSDCGNVLCDTCRDQHGVGRELMSAESLEKEEDQDEYDLCPFCSDEIVTTEKQLDTTKKLLDFAIEKLGTTLEKLTEEHEAEEADEGEADAEEIKRIDSSLPTDPEKTKGTERVLAGLLLAERANLVVEIAPDQALENARLAVKLNPSLQESCWSLLADLMEARGNGSLRASIDFYNQAQEASDWKGTRTLLEESIAADPTFPWSYNDLAWHLATSENLAERNGQEAVKFAIKACELDAYHYWGLLDTLAASYAENGEFPDAVLRMTQAITNCPDDGEEMEKLLERYKSGMRFLLPPDFDSMEALLEHFAAEIDGEVEDED